MIQQDVAVSTSELCEEYQVYVQDAPDLVSPIAVRVNIRLQKPESSPVLDAFSPAAWEFFVSAASTVTCLIMMSLFSSVLITVFYVQIPFSKDCGADETCFSDLMLSVEREPPIR